MLGAIRYSGKAKAILACLAALVLALRLFSPAGYMPVLGANGIVVTLCTGQGEARVVLDREADMPMSPSSAAGDDCAFAVGGAAPLLPARGPHILWAAVAGPLGAIAFAINTGRIARLAAPPPPASGPPQG